MIATTSGLNRGLRIYSCIMIIFMFYHRSNKMYSDSDSDSSSANNNDVSSWSVVAILLKFVRFVARMCDS